MIGNQGVEFEVSADVARFIEGINRAETSLQGLEARAKAAASGMTRGFSGVHVALGNAAARMDSVSRNLGSVVNPLFNTMVRGLGAVAGAVGLLTRYSLRIGGDFQQEMTTVATISRATGAELAALTEKARQLGRDLPRSASQAAEAMTLLAQKGWDVQRIQDSVEHVMNLSISQVYGLSESADLLSSTMTAFNLDAGQAGFVTDLFNNAANQSALTMDKLRVALGYSAPVAAAFGMKVEELVAQLAVLANQGLDASTMGAGWRMAAQKIQDDMAKGGLALRKLGVEIKNADGTARNFREVFEDLQKVLAEGGTQKASEAMSFFGMRAGTVGIILAQGADQILNFEKRLVEMGTTQEAIARRMGDWNMVKEIFKSAREEAAITLFDQLQGSLVPFTNRLTELTNVFNKWLERTKAGEVAVRAFARGMGITVQEGKGFENWLNAIKIEDFASRIEGVAAGVKALGNAFVALAQRVPWEYIATNFEKIALTISSFWLGGKILAVLANVTRLAQGLSWFAAAHPVVAGIAAVAAAFGAFAYAVDKAEQAQKDLQKAEADDASSIERLKQAEIYLEAKRGDIEAFQLLNDEFQRMAVEAFAKDQESFSKLSDRYQYMVEHRAKEFGVEIAKAVSPRSESLMEAFDKGGDESEIVNRMKGLLGVEVLKAWDESGKQGVEAYLKNLVDLPKKVRKLAGRASDEIVRARVTREYAGIDKNMLLTEDAIQQAMKQYEEMSSMAKQVAEDLNIPLERMGEILGQQFSEAMSTIVDETQEIAGNPFLAEGITRGVTEALEKTALSAGEFGQAALKSFRSATTEANKTKDAVSKLRDELNKSTQPMRMITEAMKGGFLSGSALKDAEGLLSSLMETASGANAKMVEKQWADLGINISDALMKQLAKASEVKVFEDIGLERQGKKESPFGDFVKSAKDAAQEVGAHMQKALSPVTASESTRKVTEAIERGISQPSATGIAALDRLHQAAIRAFDAIIERGTTATEIFGGLARGIDASTAALSKGLPASGAPLSGATGSVDARANLSVSVNIQRMEVRNGDEGGEQIARAIGDKAAQAARSLWPGRDILGALTN